MKIQIRSDRVKIDGYVNAVGRDSRRLTDENGYAYYEQMQPGVFARALSKGGDVKCLLDHDRELGSTGNGLTLEEDNIGLRAQFESTDPELIQLAKDGKLQGWSFGFFPLDTKDEYASDGHRVIVTELDLKEVSIIDDKMTPCYAGTSIHTRADGNQEKILLRAFDNDVVTRSFEEDGHNAPAKPDYTAYDEVITRLKTNSYGGK